MITSHNERIKRRRGMTLKKISVQTWKRMSMCIISKKNIPEKFVVMPEEKNDATDSNPSDWIVI